MSWRPRASRKWKKINAYTWTYLYDGELLITLSCTAEHPLLYTWTAMNTKADEEFVQGNPCITKAEGSVPETKGITFSVMKRALEDLAVVLCRSCPDLNGYRYIKETPKRLRSRAGG